MPNVDSMVTLARAFDRLRETVFISAIHRLNLSRGSRGLDAGCGVGLQTQRLAESAGSDGGVIGLDLSEETLEQARTIAREAGLSDRLTFVAGDVHAMPFDDDQFDWAWSADCIGYAPFPTDKPIEELARVVRPSGTVALLAWSSEILLPGYPRLESLLGATAAGIAPFEPEGGPERHFLNLADRLREAGLENVSATTLAGDVRSPMDPEIAEAMRALFEMRWDSAAVDFPEEARVEYRLLCRPGSPDFLPDRPDYYAFFTYTMFSGRVAG